MTPDSTPRIAAAACDDLAARALVERVGKAIYDAVEPLSGDPIAVVLHLSEHLFWDDRLPGATDVEQQLAAVRIICETAAAAAIAAMPDEAILGAEERHGGLRVQPIAATDAQRRAARQTEMWKRGDMRLVWVSEGDLDMLSFAPDEAAIRASERERCARVAEAAVTYVVGEQRDLCDRIAAAIRALEPVQKMHGLGEGK